MIALDTRLQGDLVVLRPSMIKFEGSKDSDIEICESAYRPLPMYLNRQFIKILEDMGVEDEFFLNLQAQEVQRLRTITTSPVNASSFLKRQSIGDSIQLPWLINKLDILGVDFQQDGFLRDVLELCVLTELRLLKHKTRIPVKNGWHLHGLMDETGLLEEGQVYCIAIEEGRRHVITGNNLIISRAPALHPGDVQLVEGIMPPPGSPLHALSNCICFSAKGQRDLPSQLSGGDLDGDRYYIMWDKDARPSKTFTPADYPRLPPIDIGRTVISSDMINFFIKFMESDQLGRIAVLHRVLADQRDDGTLSLDCKMLAEMHSTAVDFSKTGIPVRSLLSSIRDNADISFRLICPSYQNTPHTDLTLKLQGRMSRFYHAKAYSLKHPEAWMTTATKEMKTMTLLSTDTTKATKSSANSIVQSTSVRSSKT